MKLKQIVAASAAVSIFALSGCGTTYVGNDRLTNRVNRNGFVTNAARGYNDNNNIDNHSDGLSSINNNANSNRSRGYGYGTAARNSKDSTATTNVRSRTNTGAAHRTTNNATGFYNDGMGYVSRRHETDSGTAGLIGSTTLSTAKRLPSAGTARTSGSTITAPKITAAKSTKSTAAKPAATKAVTTKAAATKAPAAAHKSTAANGAVTTKADVTPAQNVLPLVNTVRNTVGNTMGNTARTNTMTGTNRGVNNRTNRNTRTVRNNGINRTASGSRNYGGRLAGNAVLNGYDSNVNTYMGADTTNTARSITASNGYHGNPAYFGSDATIYRNGGYVRTSNRSGYNNRTNRSLINSYNENGNYGYGYNNYNGGYRYDNMNFGNTRTGAGLNRNTYRNGYNRPNGVIQLGNTGYVNGY